MESALDDLLVVDFSRILAGPLATMQLADFGARVIKVERPGAGDDTRTWGPPYDDQGVATYFLSINRNKQSIALDLGTPEGIAQARALTRQADVVVENFRPGVMDRLGLGYEALAADNPALVYCSISGFGSAAGAAMPGYDLLVQAVGGLMSITGSPDGEPQKVGVALVDVICGLYASNGILTALHHRRRTGEGQRVEVDLLSALLGAFVNQGSAYTAAGVVPRRLGNAHPSIAPYEVVPTGDGDLVLACGSDGQFRKLCAQLGLDELADDERYATNDARVTHRTSLRERLVAVLVHRSATEWAADLLAVGVPAGEINDLAGAVDLATQLGLEPTVDVPRPDGTSVSLIRNPLRLSATPASYRSAPPSLGQDQAAVLPAADAPSA